MILKVDEVEKFYPVSKGLGKVQKVQALRGVSLELNQGETLAIVGESGCGKSTLAKVLMKIENVSSGSVFLQGKPLKDISALELSSFVQMVFQDPYSSLNPRKKIFDIIAEPLVIRGVSTVEIRKSVEAVVHQVGLRPEMIERYPHMLSGGQRQRVGIARALITKPQLIVCDEPVSALDVSVQGQVLNLLLDLQRDFNLSYLFISHDLGVVRFIADRVAVMYLGKIVEMGSSHEIFTQARHPYTQLLLRSAPSFETSQINSQTTKEFETESGEIPSPLNPPKSCGFSSRCPHKTSRCEVESPPLEMKGPWRVACFEVS